MAAERTTRRAHRVVPAVVVALALGGAALTGCSSSGSTAATTTTTTAVMNREQYLAKADEICRTHQKKLETVPSPGDTASATAFLEQSMAILRENIRQLRELTPPAGTEAEFRAFYDKTSKVIEDIQTNIPEITKDATAFQRMMIPYNERFEEIGREAAVMGFKNCGVGGESE